MCFNMAIVTEMIKLEEDFGSVFDTYPAYATTDNEILYHQRSGFSHPAWPILPAAEERIMTSAYWGLVPHWTRDRESALTIQNKTLNARSETIWKLPSYRSAMKSSKRCLIPVSGFFEPHSHGGKSYPFYLHRKGELFALGGLYEQWYGPETGREYRSFSIITVPAEGIVDEIHNKKHRMPLLIEKSDYDAWLDPQKSREEVDDLMQSRPYDLYAHPVSRDIYAHDERAVAPGIADIRLTGIEDIDNIARV